MQRAPEGPPPSRSGQGTRLTHYDEEVAQLRNDPGVWWIVAEHVPDARAKPYKKRGCEVRTERLTSSRNRVRVWARWPKDTDRDRIAAPKETD